MSQYKDQVVMITGASGGLGFEAATQFGQQGAKLALCDIDAKRINSAAETLRQQDIEVYAEAFDITDEQALESFIEACVKRFGRLDVAVNNAGVDPDHSLLADTPTREFDLTMDINVKGVFLCMKYQLPQMQEQGGGAICNIASVAGVGGAPLMSVYAASKHAVIGLTKSAAFEYGKFNIRINAVCPYITRTAMLNQTLELIPEAEREQALRKFGKNTALKRIAEPDEVVAAMLFACDKKNSFMTGHELVVDGGMTAV